MDILLYKQNLGAEIYQKFSLQTFPPFIIVMFPQGKMLDLVFAVDNPMTWHEENLERNRYHYSFLRHLGTKSVTSIQKLSAGVYYNTLVTVQSQVLLSHRI